MALTLKEKIQKALWIKAFTPDGKEIREEVTFSEDKRTRTLRVYVPSSGEEVYESTSVRGKGFLGMPRWNVVIEHIGSNFTPYALYNGRF
jgi:hypothetical protein